MNASPNFSFFLEPVSPLEVGFHIKNFKNSKQNINSISVSIFKEHHEILSPIIADLINKCFETGTFPDSLKKAVVLPLFKKDDPEIMSNYRPISILPMLSKILPMLSTTSPEITYILEKILNIEWEYNYFKNPL